MKYILPNPTVFISDSSKIASNPLETGKRSLAEMLFGIQNTHICVMMEQSSRTTGAIGDLDGDGKLDLALTFNADAVLTDHRGNYVRTEVSLDLVKLDLEAQYPLLPRIGKEHKETITEPQFRPKPEQIWTGYMGANSQSIYTSDLT